MKTQLMKCRFFGFLLLILLSLFCNSMAQNNEEEAETQYALDSDTPIQMSADLASLPAKAFILLDAQTGTVMAEKNPNARLPPASVTKLMTAYVVLDAIKQGELSMDSTTVVSVKARAADGSRTYLEKGDVVTTKTLLLGLLVHSGNDSAIALAEQVSGSIEAFTQRMNQVSLKLGLTNSHWVTVNGLHHVDHYSSAHDLAIVARAIILDFPEHLELFGQKWFRYAEISQKNRNRLLFKNKIIGSDIIVDGMKTGWTIPAGYCVVNTAHKDNMRVISVVLGAPNPQSRFDTSEQLFMYAFEHFKLEPLLAVHQALTTLQVKGSIEQSTELMADQAPYRLVPKKDPAPELSLQFFAPELWITQSLPKETAYGRVRIYQNETLLSDLPLYTTTPLRLASFWERMKEIVF